LIFELYPEVAPLTVANFLKLAESRFWVEKPSFLYRVLPGFVAQGGPLSPEDEQLDAEFIPGEFGTIAHERGVLSMARPENPDGASCHFFICLGKLERLDGQYASFGRRIAGEDVLHAIEHVEKKDGLDGRVSRPVEPILIRRVEELVRDSK